MSIDPRKLQELLRDVGSGVMDERSWERRLRGFERLSELSDEELAATLLGVRAGGPAATEQIESIREAIRLLVNLRASQRQEKQAEALIEAVHQLKRTEGTLGQVLESLGRVAPLVDAASKIGGAGR